MSVDEWGAGWVDPLQASAPVAGRETLLHEAEACAKWLDVDLWGWQRHVLSVALERDEDRWARQRVIIQVCRQTGKSTLLATRMILGLLRGERMALAAQRRSAATDLWDIIVDTVLEHVPESQVRARRSFGKERVYVTTEHGRASLEVITASKTAARARTFDVLIIDEAAFISPEFLAAIRPTRLTAESPQFWFVSSAGDDGAIAWRSELSAAERAGDDVALFRWGALPDDDWASEDVWRAAIPTIEQPGGVQIAALREDWEALTPMSFAREYLSIGSTDKPAAIPLKDWRSCLGDVGQVPIGMGTHLGIDVAPDGSSAAIAAAWRDHEHNLCAALLIAGIGDNWLPGKLTETIRRYRPGAIVLDHFCPARHLVEPLRRGGQPVITTQTWAYSAACASLAQLCADQGIRIDPSPDLAEAHAAGVRRPIGRAWGVGRREGGKPVQPLVAMALAVGNLHASTSDRPVHRFDFAAAATG